MAGDPVARDTFGVEMFRQMGLFSPIAGLVMCVALWFMFRSVPLIVANMAVAMVSIIWSMGLLIGLGHPVHIMSSMSPVFLMAIATDSVHIFNEFAFRFGDVANKRRAVLDTMAAVGGPVFYSDVTTAVGFAALATATIVPVRIFGLVVAFGTLVILLMSFTLVPAILMLLREEHLGDADCYVVQSVPKSPMDYTRKLSWIDKKTFLPRKEEYYDTQNELARVFTADETRDVAVETGSAGKVYPTVTKRIMKNVKSGHRTEVTFESVAYDVGLEDDIFTERAMQNPPQKWIK